MPDSLFDKMFAFVNYSVICSNTFVITIGKKGKPYGLQMVSPQESDNSYCIIADPYFKRISIEKYAGTRFDKVVYDSIYSICHLQPQEQFVVAQRGGKRGT